MCFKRKGPDPAIAAAQKQQEDDAAAKRQSELDAATRAREKQLEEIRVANKTSEDLLKQQRQQASRQAETSRTAGGSDAPVGAPSAAMTQRRTTRAGRGRRSLLSSTAGGVGYFSRFLL